MYQSAYINGYDIGHLVFQSGLLFLFIRLQNSIRMKKDKRGHELDFLKDGPWDELYVLTKYWKSDLQFYKDDLRFLKHLTEKYFIWLTKPDSLQLVKDLKDGFFRLTEKSKDLLLKVDKHLIQLGYLVEDPNREDAGVIVTEHEHLEEEMASFLISFRKNRKEVFAITEHIIDSEELANILKT